ncbi:MAG TPA: hypothetical protein VF438_00480 [Candidatus Paceibacterota bacterium]
MKIITGIVGFYFLALGAVNVYFVSVIQSGGAFAESVAKLFLALEHPLVWILNKIPFLYVGNMSAITDITMRSSIIILCTSLLLLIGTVLLIRVED